MENQKEHFRHILFYYFRKGKNAVQAHKKLCHVYGEDTLNVERMLPENALRENDTYNFYSRFKKGADLVKTGLTGTNVMDLHLIYIKKRSCKCEPGVSDEPIREENIFDAHDLRIDPSTAERYKALRATLKFDGEKFLETKEEKRYLDIKIIDENLADPCCNKGRKLD
ncbi:Glycerate kinase [Ooceraea biroi]|uniref:Glycerate kinase n=1 Tax=Ooceraea biroi TaxID=2015173 RepID=A0A026VTZ5_OOCBI|nr:Glycerate kinase [Ooceraea biroi]